MTTSWLVTGADGQLGTDLVALLAGRPGDSVTGATRAVLDLTDEAAARGAVRAWLDAARARGDRAVLLNAAAYTAVDAAETDEATASLVNGSAPGWLAQELAGRGRLVHVSTDYVFDGSATRPYEVDDEPAPRSAYGRTKLAGERAVAAAGGDAVVVRTAWVYGRHGGNFVRTMARLATERPTVEVVDDQTGSPTWTADLAGGLVALGARAEPPPPLLHLTNSGQATWRELAQAVFAGVGADPGRVHATTTEAFRRPAPRPAWSVLSGAAWDALDLPARRAWPVALAAALAAGVVEDLP